MSERPVERAEAGPAPEGLGGPSAGAAPLHVVALGASAGGLAAFERFFRAVDHPTGFAYVVVQHLSPEHESILPQLLAAFTRMPVEPVLDGTRPQADHVYVIPPNATLIFREGRLRLATLEPRSSRQPISAFLSSLAEELGPLAVGVILSGTGSDGSAGLHAVRAHGGLTLVQSPAEAQYDSMPRSALATGDVDMVLPTADMPEMIAREVRRRAAGPRAVPAGVPADPLTAITEALRRHTGKEFGAFKRTTLLRRVRRRLTATGISSLGDYLARVEVDGAEAGTLASDLMIGVTRFFRDRPAFQALAERALAKLFEFAGDQPVRVWVPGCSTGQEAYTIAILLADHARGRDGPAGPPRFQIFATDINEAALATARVGHYPASVAADVPAGWLERYFVAEDGGYTVTREIRDACIFSIHDVLRDPPFSRIDLLSCRNLLIYIDPATQARLLPLFHYALRPSGFLFLGNSETVGDLSGLFDPVEAKHRLFRRSGGAGVRVQFPLSVAGVEPRPRRVGAPEAGEGGAAAEPLRALTAGALDELGTAAALVDGRGVARYFAGPVSRYLPTPTGAPSVNVLELATGDLKLELSAALQAAAAGGPVRRALRLDGAAGPTQVELTVRPQAVPGGPRDAYLVLLRELEPPGAAAAPGDQRTHQLEGELRVATDRWRRAVQDLESTNEELRSANEELQTMNEELQSSNEELQLSQEELQSVNEELNTVNTELATKADEVNALYADLQNLFQSTRIATVVLDRELCVTRFTPTATRLFPLAAADVGRPLDDLAAPFVGASVLADARTVLEDLAPRERILELKGGGGWHLLRVLPYLSLSRSVEGVVLTFTDVSELKRAEQALRESETRYRTSLEALLDAFAVFRPVIGADGRPVDFEVEYLNAAAQALLGAGEGRSRLRELVPAGSPLLAMLTTAQEQGVVVEHHEVAGLGDAASRRIYDLRASPLGRGEVVLAWREVTDRLRATEALREADRRKDDFMAVLGHELRNPLAALQTALHLEQRAGAATPGGEARHLELMRRQVASLGRLVDDLLDVTRISRGKVRLQVAPVDLADLARAEVAVHAQAEAGRLELALTAPPGPVWVRGDAERITQVLGNLIGNACKFSDPGGRVEVEVHDVDGLPELSVRDHGIGMTAETLAGLFQPFRQAEHGPVRGRGGLGLGLSLVKGLAELMGADVWARSEGLGRGSELRVRFQPSPPPPPTRARPAIQAAAARRVRILVVDDNADVRQTLVEYLADLRGHAVVSAGDCEEALARALAWRPDVVLCDVGLPRVSGHDFARRAREEPGLRDAVLVALTGYGTDADKLRSREAGFHLHLTKPIDLEELDRLLAEIAERGHAAPSLRGQAASPS